MLQNMLRLPLKLLLLPLRKKLHLPLTPLLLLKL